MGWMKRAAAWLRLGRGLLGLMPLMLWAAPGWADQTRTFPTEQRWVLAALFYGGGSAKNLYDHSFASAAQACAFAGELAPEVSNPHPEAPEWNSTDGMMVVPCIGNIGQARFSLGRTWEMTYCAALEQWNTPCEKTCPDHTEWVGEVKQCLPTKGIPRALTPPACPCLQEVVAEPTVGNPLYPLRGVKREVVDTGLRLGRLSLTFTYDTTSAIPAQPPELAQWVDLGQHGGVLGTGLWFSNFHRQLRPQGQTSADAPIWTFAERGDGVTKTLVRGDGSLTSTQAGDADRLGAVFGGFAYDDGTQNVREFYDGNGRLLSMTWTDGTRIQFGYSAADSAMPGMMVQASDNLGRSLAFGYVDPGAGGAPRLTTITDAAGRVTTLGHDSHGSLASIRWPDERTRRFLYENEGHPLALTGIEDERGVRYATFGYDAQGLAISSEHAGGVARYSVSYATPPQIHISRQVEQGYAVHYADWVAPSGVVLTEPNGNTRSLDVASVDGKSFLGGQTQAAGAGSQASASVQRFQGSAISQDDFNGTRSCFVREVTRSLPTVSVKGLAGSQACDAVTPANAALPSGAVKTSTQWHPDWSLRVKVAAPKQITTNVYNGQPDPFDGNATASCESGTTLLPDGKPITVLCKQVTQATTDADGHLGFSAALQAGAAIRVSTWTYNESGQVLTAKTTRGGVTVTTSSTYFADTNANHTKGDLATTTDAAGKVTTYDKYTRAGQLLQSTDSDGVVTVNTYDLRQRLLTTTVGGETTTYTYDPVGQLIRVTEHDGGWIAYEYDDAHRQKAVSDDGGNRIEYALDNAGNSTGQTVKDPTGSLKRNMARVMDALGRAQENSGRE
jgi:YD repeat-containing protein